MDVSYLRKLYKAKKIYHSLGEPSQLYLAGWSMFIVSLLFALFSGGVNTNLASVVIVLLVFSVVFIVLGFSVDAYRFFLRLWDSITGRWTLGVLMAGVVKFSYLISKHELNNLTGLPSSYLTDSVTLFTVLTIPLVTLAMFAIVLLLFLVLYIPVFMTGTLYEMLDINKIENCVVYKYIFRKKSNARPGVLLPGRFAGAYASLLIIGFLVVSYSQAFSSVDEYKREAIAYVDYYKKGYCKNVEKNERYLPMKGNYMSVVSKTRSGWKFTVRQCRSKSE
ncbi:MAG: hypothetical protein JAZ11_09735 [Candidatus Thiodiazotropha lotti]|nr:hypothetical protein [Candidatus Thiodiazotropha lotti]